MASFFTSSVVGSRCILYLARGCQRSYCACRFLPAVVRQGRGALEGGLRVGGESVGRAALAGPARLLTLQVRDGHSTAALSCGSNISSMQPLAERHWRAMLEPREQAQVAVLQTPTFDPDSVFCSTSVGGAPIVSSALGACMDSGSTQHSRRAQGEILITSGGSTPAGGRGTAGGV